MSDNEDKIYVAMVVIFITMILSSCFLEPSGHDSRCDEFTGRSHLACMGGHG